MYLGAVFAFDDKSGYEVLVGVGCGVVSESHIDAGRVAFIGGGVVAICAVDIAVSVSLIEFVAVDV